MTRPGVTSGRARQRLRASVVLRSWWCNWRHPPRRWQRLSVVPGSNAMMFMQPANWEKFAQERAHADATRIAQAQQAGITELVERDPNITGWV